MLFGDSCQHSLILDYFLPLVPSTGRCSWFEFPSLNHLREGKPNQLQGLLDFSGWMSYYFTLGFPGVTQNRTTYVLLDSVKSYSEAYFIVKLQEYTNWQEVWEGFSCPLLLLTMSAPYKDYSSMYMAIDFPNTEIVHDPKKVISSCFHISIKFQSTLTSWVCQYSTHLFKYLK